MNYIPLWLVDVAKETLLNRGFNLVRFIEVSPHSDRFFFRFIFEDTGGFRNNFFIKFENKESFTYACKLNKDDFKILDFLNYKDLYIARLSLEDVGNFVLDAI